jgi:5'-nucleotidase
MHRCEVCRAKADIYFSFPFEDPVIVMKVKGEALLEALENSVSMYPALEGRFPQVSNIEIEFDPRLPRMKRLKYARVGGQPIDLQRQYKLVTRGYMGRGKDGYDALLVKSEGGKCEEIVSEENGVLISTILRQYFMSLKVLGKWKNFSASLGRCFGRIHEEVHAHHPVVEPIPPFKDATDASNTASQNYPSRKGADDTALDENDEESDTPPVPTVVSEQERQVVSEQERQLVIMRKVMRKWWRLAGLKGHSSPCDEMNGKEFATNWTKVNQANLGDRASC